MNDRRPPSCNGVPEAARRLQEVVAPPIIPSSELFRGGRELVIEHNGETYSLRQTSKGGLILTK